MFNEKGDVIGVAFSGLSGGAENIGKGLIAPSFCAYVCIGYIIPKPVIENFLYDYKHTKSGAICGFGFAFQPCENETLRKKFGLVHPNTFVHMHAKLFIPDRETVVFLLLSSHHAVLQRKVDFFRRISLLRLMVIRSEFVGWFLSLTFF